jgi:hypothetical protein
MHEIPQEVMRKFGVFEETRIARISRMVRGHSGQAMRNFWERARQAGVVSGAHAASLHVSAPCETGKCVTVNCKDVAGRAAGN